MQPKSIFPFLLYFVLLLIWGCKQSSENKVKARRIEYKDKTYDVFTAKYPAEKIKFYWKDDAGNKLKSIGNLANYLQTKNRTLVFATNAGMYMENNSPLGLYIENGKEKSHLNLTMTGKGNFYLQPNGVFFLTDSVARIVPTEKFNLIKDNARYATQSGPMLVIDGEINKAFTKGSANVNIRSGVGITSDNQVIFAISNETVNFYDFAGLFRDQLKCRNALFLDGAISKMYLPELGRTEEGGDFGAIIGIEK